MTINTRFIRRIPKPMSEISKFNILVVDDEPFNVMALKLVCKDYVKNLDEAYNGFEALNKVLTSIKLRSKVMRNKNVSMTSYFWI
jgi:response regulator RpfG family c-di-GMP phosphodiesterase